MSRCLWPSRLQAQRIKQTWAAVFIGSRRTAPLSCARLILSPGAGHAGDYRR
jgi:hypothetical protein